MTPKPPILGIPATYIVIHFIFSSLQNGSNLFILDGLRIVSTADIGSFIIKYSIPLIIFAIAFGKNIIRGDKDSMMLAFGGLLMWNILTLDHYEGVIFTYDFYSTETFLFQVSEGAFAYSIPLTAYSLCWILSFTMLEELNPIDKILDRRIEENRETEEESERLGLHAGLGLHEEVNLNEPSQTENEAEDESSEKEESESTIPLKTRTEILLQRMKEMEEDS